jgi:hypothetical protein
VLVGRLGMGVPPLQMSKVGSAFLRSKISCYFR